MRRYRLLLISAVVFVAALSAASASAAPATFLYSASAGWAKVDGARVTLPASADVAWFTDRPVRRSGSTTLGDVVDVWSVSGLDASPPNAALVVTRKGETSTHIVTLTQARRKGTTVSFRVRTVPGGTEAGMRSTGRLTSGTYGRAELFIDDVATPPCGSVVPTGTSCLYDFGSTISANGGTITLCGVNSATAGPVYVSWYQMQGKFITNPTSSVSPPQCPATTQIGVGAVGPVSIGYFIGSTGVVRVTAGS
jgi:hypothetical protein